jgi:imidazoleglycerol-phosphate dehydratase
MDPEVFEHFFRASVQAGLNAHLLFQGRNDHHQCEALFKAFGIALGEAVSLRPGRTDIPSTKGTF